MSAFLSARDQYRSLVLRLRTRLGQAFRASRQAGTPNIGAKWSLTMRTFRTLWELHMALSDDAIFGHRLAESGGEIVKKVLYSPTPRLSRARTRSPYVHLLCFGL